MCPVWDRFLVTKPIPRCEGFKTAGCISVVRLLQISNNGEQLKTHGAKAMESHAAIRPST